MCDRCVGGEINLKGNEGDSDAPGTQSRFLLILLKRQLFGLNDLHQVYLVVQTKRCLFNKISRKRDSVQESPPTHLSHIQVCRDFFVIF